MAEHRRKDDADAKPFGGQGAETQGADQPPPVDPGTIHPDRTGTPPPPPPTDGDE